MMPSGGLFKVSRVVLSHHHHRACSKHHHQQGFGAALLDFVTSLAARPTLPHVLSMSLGSLSGASCELLCAKAAATGEHTLAECQAYIRTQRQVCMFLSTAQTARIDTGLQVRSALLQSAVPCIAEPGTRRSRSRLPSRPPSRPASRPSGEAVLPARTCSAGAHLAPLRVLLRSLLCATMPRRGLGV
jgi:hypothetical protein